MRQARGRRPTGNATKGSRRAAAAAHAGRWRCPARARRQSGPHGACTALEHREHNGIQTWRGKSDRVRAVCSARGIDALSCLPHDGVTSTSVLVQSCLRRPAFRPDRAVWTGHQPGAKPPHPPGCHISPVNVKRGPIFGGDWQHPAAGVTCHPPTHPSLRRCPLLCGSFVRTCSRIAFWKMFSDSPLSIMASMSSSATCWPGVAVRSRAGEE